MKDAFNLESSKFHSMQKWRMVERGLGFNESNVLYRVENDCKKRWGPGGKEEVRELLIEHDLRTIGFKALFGGEVKFCSWTMSLSSCKPSA